MRLLDAQLFQSTNPQDVLASWILLESLSNRAIPTPSPTKLTDLGSWYDAALLLIQLGEGDLDDLLPHNTPPSLKTITHAQSLLHEQSLTSGRQLLDDRILALPNPLADLMTDLINLSTRNWHQTQQIITRWEFTESDVPSSNLLDIQKHHLRNGLLDLVRSQTPELSQVAFTEDLSLQLLCGRIEQLDAKMDAAFGTKPVFSFSDQKGLTGMAGFYHAPSPNTTPLRYVTPIPHPDPDRNWTRAELCRTGFMMLLELPITVTSALTHQLACMPRGRIPAAVHRDLGRRLGGGGWDRDLFIALRRRYVLAHEWGHHAHAIPRPEIPGVTDDSWHRSYKHLAGEAWADHAALRLVLPDLDERECVHFDFMACRRFFTIDENRSEAADGMHDLADALFYPALLSGDPVATHRGYLERIAELCRAADKAGKEPDPLPLVGEIMDSVGREM